VADSFYVPLGDGRWQATVHTSGPWDARAQHGGPPSALLGRAIQECQPREDMVIARFSWELDIKRWQFINPELTVHLHREAVGEWVCLDAQTSVSVGGAGLATSVLSDLDGPVGVGAQSLLIAPRPPAVG
jgi:hypothetical protein